MFSTARMSGGQVPPKIPRFPPKILPTKVEMRAAKQSSSTAKETVDVDHWEPPPCKHALVMREKREQTEKKEKKKADYEQREKRLIEKRKMDEQLDEQLDDFKNVFETGLKKLRGGLKQD